eukprot:symbB.v1.2.017688.t1/scaffold1368.1/size123082/15
MTLVPDESFVWTQDQAIGSGLYHQDPNNLLQLPQVAGPAVHLLLNLAWPLRQLHLERVLRHKNLFQRDIERFLLPELHLKFVDLKRGRNFQVHLLVEVFEGLMRLLHLLHLLHLHFLHFLDFLLRR